MFPHLQYWAPIPSTLALSIILDMYTYLRIMVFLLQVIPEFDMPGHAHAAIKAMETRYHRLAPLGDEAAARQYLLSDLEDVSQYLSIQYFRDNAINPCLQSTFNFIGTVCLKLLPIFTTKLKLLRLVSVDI